MGLFLEEKKPGTDIADPPSTGELDELRQMRRERRGAGGTPGGVGMFLLGLLLSIVGGYLVMNQVIVSSNPLPWLGWGWGGMGRSGGFGLTMLPMLIGIGALFFNGKSKLGWVLTFGGVAIILAAVLMSMSIHFAPTSLFNVTLMFGMLAAGIGLVMRSLRPAG